MAEKLTKAGRRALEAAPDEWDVLPIWGDSRPRVPLMRHGFIEQRRIDVTPSDWDGMVRVVRMEWRRTNAGRAALSQHQDKP